MDDLHALLDDAIATVNADGGTVHLIGPDGLLHLKASRNVPTEVADVIRLIPVGKGMAGLAVERNAPVETCNLQTDTTGDVRPGAKATMMEGAVVIPIRRGGSPIGSLGVANRGERTFTNEEKESLLRVAARISAWQTAVEEAERQAHGGEKTA